MPTKCLQNGSGTWTQNLKTADTHSNFNLHHFGDFELHSDSGNYAVDMNRILLTFEGNI